MGFWERKVRNSFEGMFDYNRDRKLDTVEEGFMLDFIEEQIRGDEAEDDGFDDDFDSDDFDE